MLLYIKVCLRKRIVIQNPNQSWGSGGDERDRTADPLLARQVLSQLSYTPIGAHFSLLRGLRDSRQAVSEMSASTYFPVPSPAKYLRLGGA